MSFNSLHLILTSVSAYDHMQSALNTDEKPFCNKPLKIAFAGLQTVPKTVHLRPKIFICKINFYQNQFSIT